MTHTAHQHVAVPRCPRGQALGGRGERWVPTLPPGLITPPSVTAAGHPRGSSFFSCFQRISGPFRNQEVLEIRQPNIISRYFLPKQAQKVQSFQRSDQPANAYLPSKFKHAEGRVHGPHTGGGTASPFSAWAASGAAWAGVSSYSLFQEPTLPQGAAGKTKGRNPSSKRLTYRRNRVF